MTDKIKSYNQCHQYNQFCEKCELGWCYWFSCRKSPLCADDCKAFNSFSEVRKHRDENAEIFPKVVEFYEFLQGISVPERFTLKHKPKLSAKKAFTIIYTLQEHLHILPDCFEKCEGCDMLFDSEREGLMLDDQYELNGKTLPKKYWGNWCDSCVPNIDFAVK